MAIPGLHQSIILTINSEFPSLYSFNSRNIIIRKFFLCSNSVSLKSEFIMGNLKVQDKDLEIEHPCALFSFLY